MTGDTGVSRLVDSGYDPMVTLYYPMTGDTGGSRCTASGYSPIVTLHYPSVNF
jgi:hypothetical protein